jgi:hypothetical protein
MGSSDLTGSLTLFLTQMIGLSVAAERVTETLKQWVGPWMKGWSQDRYAAAIQCIAVLSGMAVTAMSGLNPLKIPLANPFDWFNRADWLSWCVTGILVSGGSAFWNHLLDILQATKVQKEQLANLASSAAANAAVNTAVNAAAVVQHAAATAAADAGGPFPHLPGTP